MNIKTNIALKDDDTVLEHSELWLCDESLVCAVKTKKSIQHRGLISEQEYCAEIKPLRPKLDIEYLFQSRYRQLKSFLMKRMYNEHDAEDICQNTYLEALRKADGYKGLSRPDVWLFGIALNLLRNHNKKERNRGRMWEENFGHETIELDETNNDPCHLVDCEQRLIKINDKLETLPDEMTVIFDAIVLENVSYQDAASAYGIPTGTVRSRLSRVREKLKEASLA